MLVLGTEDCLTLNVYRPDDLKAETLKPVMVFIHGGAFTIGSGGDMFYSPEPFLDYDIVSFNYVLLNVPLISFGIYFLCHITCR